MRSRNNPPYARRVLLMAPERRSAGVPGQGLAEAEGAQGEDQQAVEAEDGQHAAPGREPQQFAAQGRSQYGRDAHHQEQPGQHDRRRPSLEEVPDDGQRDHGAGRGPDPLQHPQRAEGCDVGGHQDEQGRHDVQDRPGHQRPQPAQAVGQRADHVLAQRQTEQCPGQGLLDRRGAARQLVPDRREGGEIHVDGQRAEGD